MNHLDNRMYLEKEFIRINSEFERLKLRQSTLEGTCSDLRSGASARESRVEEQHRKAIQQHRSELDAFIGSTGKKVFEAINVLRENNVTAMRADLDGFIGTVDLLQCRYCRYYDGGTKMVNDTHYVVHPSIRYAVVSYSPSIHPSAHILLTYVLYVIMFSSVHQLISLYIIMICAL